MRWTLPRSQMRKQLHPVTRRSILWGQFPLMSIPCLHISRTIKQTLSLFAGFTWLSSPVSGPRLFREAKNLKTALTNAHIVQAKKKKKFRYKRVGGPFQYPSFPSIQVSPLGLVPQKDGDYHLIHHQSINSFRDLLSCTVHYASIDDAASIRFATLGPGALVAKYDVKSALRLIPIAPSVFDLLGFKFQEKYNFDKMLQFGASISCAIWEKFASSLHWIIQPKSRNPSILHYLDDFPFVGSPNSNLCHRRLSKIS